MASTETVPNESSTTTTTSLPVDEEAMIVREHPSSCPKMKNGGNESKENDIMSLDTKEYGGFATGIDKDDSHEKGIHCQPDLSSTSTHSGTNPLIQNHMKALEARVQELEGKLATLSMVLQLQQRQPSVSPYRLSPPRSPLPFEEQSSTDSSIIMMMSASPTPSGVDSLPPQRPSSQGTHVRNLSFRVLHSEDYVSSKLSPDRSPLGTSDDEGDDGLTQTHSLDRLTENLPTPENSNIFLPDTLPGQLQKSYTSAVDATSLPLPKTITTTGTTSYNEDQSSQDNPCAPIKGTLEACNNGNIDKAINDSISTKKSSPAAAISSTTLQKVKSSSPTQMKKRCIMSTTPPSISFNRITSPSNATSMKLKWLDYLNSVQESNYDTDKQMEEFVKVPSAVEALLSFGFWICVDSFLYTLTILPIRFVWSCLLLLRFTFFRIFKTAPGSDGPFRFHRR
jgi:hypothetical protein